MDYKFTCIDVCMPDYFQGPPGGVLAFAVHKEMTEEEAVDALLDEYKLDYYVSQEGDILEFTDAELKQMADEFILNSMPFASMPVGSPDENLKSVYCYVIIEKDE